MNGKFALKFICTLCDPPTSNSCKFFSTNTPQSARPTRERTAVASLPRRNKLWTLVLFKDKAPARDRHPIRVVSYSSVAKFIAFSTRKWKIFFIFSRNVYIVVGFHCCALNGGEFFTGSPVAAIRIFDRDLHNDETKG